MVFILARPVDRVSIKKLQPFPVRQFLSAVNQGNSIPGCRKYRKWHGRFAILFKLSSVPAVLIMVSGKIHPDSAGWKTVVVLPKEAIQSFNIGFVIGKIAGFMHPFPCISGIKNLLIL